MTGSPLFPVVVDKIDSHGGGDHGSGSLNSQSENLVSCGERRVT